MTTLNHGAGVADELDPIRARQTLMLEEVYRAALRGWELSCGERVKARTTTNRTMRGKGGDVVPLPDLVVTETSTGTGNVQYLVRALQALAAIRRLWGLETPGRGGRSAPLAPDLAELLEAVTGEKEKEKESDGPDRSPSPSLAPDAAAGHVDSEDPDPLMTSLISRTKVEAMFAAAASGTGPRAKRRPKLAGGRRR